MSRLPPARHWPLWIIILLGTGLRLHQLTYHSIWFDEAISIRWASTSVAHIIEVSMNLVEDRLPPLYYLLLKGWVQVAGLSEFSVRFLSVIFGILLIPIIYLIARRLISHSGGLLAALLTALNPFLIWYSQEARMYALAVLLSSGGVLFFVVAISRRTKKHRWSGWLGFGLCALAGLYTHLYTGFLWPALALWLVLTPPYLKRYWLPFGLAMSSTLTLFLPLALATWRFSGESQPGDPLAHVGERAIDLFQAFVIWQAPLSMTLIQIITLGLALFLGLGFALGLTQRGGRLLILLLLVPFAIASLLLLRSDLAFFGHRYFIVMVPWLLLLQSLAMVWVFTLRPKRLAMTIGFTSLIVVLLLSGWPISGQWSATAAKEAWRQTGQYLKVHAQPDDAVFIHPEWVRFPYQFYETQLQLPGQTYAAFFAIDENTDLDGPLNGVVSQHDLVWLVQSHIEQPDPDRRVENWFANRYPLATELYPPGLTLKAYVPGYQLFTLPPEVTVGKIPFAAGLTLEGFQLPATKFTQQDALFHPPSTWIHVTLYWSAASNTRDVVPQVQLLDDIGQVWGVSLDRANDAVRIYPPLRWESDQIIRQDLDVNLNPAIPVGLYHLVVMVDEVKESLTMVEIVEK